MFAWNVFLCFNWTVNYFKISFSIIHQTERFGVQNSTKFSGGAHLRPLSRFSQTLGFTLKCQVLCTLNTCFARFQSPKFWWLVVPLLWELESSLIPLIWIVWDRKGKASEMSRTPKYIFFLCLRLSLHFNKIVGDSGAHWAQIVTYWHDVTKW